MLNFDSNGYLNPSKIFELNKDEFESVFAINKHRQSLLKSLNALLIDLKKLSNIPLKIWIDGSFITKKEYPKDIDIVVFLNTDFYFHFKNELSFLIEKYRFQSIDLYYLPVYPLRSALRFQTEYDQNEWYFLYSHDINGLEKGSIQIEF